MRKIIIILVFILITVIYLIVPKNVYKAVLGVSTQNSAQISLIVIEKSLPIKVTILDKDKRPIVNAKVTLYSFPIVKYTDKNGIVVFENPPSGEHRILVEYKGKILESKFIKNIQAMDIAFNVDLTSENKPIIQTREEGKFSQNKSILVLLTVLLIVFSILVLLFNNRGKFH